ncbi:MAG TPA: hypothetical protein VJH65_03400 [Candidatus Nanoarchaeia archaeon]|nr:hypothetical protein [Candidatus Nanoarchaeia archaeon]
MKIRFGRLELTAVEIEPAKIDRDGIYEIKIGDKKPYVLWGGQLLELIKDLEDPDAICTIKGPLDEDYGV